MEKNQYELCIKVLQKLDKAGALKNIIVIGSWCIAFYKQYFTDNKYLSSFEYSLMSKYIREPLFILQAEKFDRLIVYIDS